MRDHSRFIRALIGQESGGDASAQNGRTGAFGLAQILPENIPAWAAEARVDPNDMSNENQMQIINHKVNQYYEMFGGDYRKVAIAWYAGPAAVDNPQYNYDRKQGNGDEPAINEYADSVLGRMEGSNWTQPRFKGKSMMGGDIPEGGFQLEPPEDHFLKKGLDSLTAGVEGSFFGGLYQQSKAQVLSETSAEEYKTYRLTQEDVDYVTQAFPDNKKARDHILMSAGSRSNLMLLVQMEKERHERVAKVSNYGLGYQALAMVGGALGDPTTYWPIFGKTIKIGIGLGNTLMARMGGYAPRVDKVLRFTTKHGGNFGLYGTGNLIDTYLAEKATGDEQDYKAAFLMGGAFGVVSPYVIQGLWNVAKGGGRQVGKFISTVDNAENHMIALASDAPLPNQQRPTFNLARQYNDLDFIQQSSSKTLKILSEGNKVFVITRKQAQEIGAELKRTIGDDVKAFYNELEDYTVIIKDKLKPTDNVDNLIAHEVGIHGGLAKHLSEKAQESLKNAVEKRSEKPPNQYWADAKKTNKSGQWQETLAYFIEHAGIKDNVVEGFKRQMMKGLRRLGYKGVLSDVEMKGYIQDVLKREVETSHHYISNPDGSAVVNGVWYSKENLANPSNLDLIFDKDSVVRNSTQADFWKPLRYGTQGLESWGIFGTNYGVISNSNLKSMREIAPDLFVDVRGREYKGKMIKPGEVQKSETMRELMMSHNVYTQFRSDVMMDNLGKNITTALDMPRAVQEFNKQVVLYHDAVYAGHTRGVDINSFSPEVKQAAKLLHESQEVKLEKAKESGDRFGVLGNNLVDKDFTLLSHGYHRVTDSDKLLVWKASFNNEAESIRWLSEYTREAADKKGIMESLLKKKNKELTEGQKKFTEEDIPVEEFHDYLMQWADNTARGTVDQNASVYREFSGSSSDPLPFLRERFPMDTSYVKQMPDGSSFSFNEHLRNFDVDDIQVRTANRLSGEMALHNFEYHYGSIDDLKKMITIQQQQAIQARKMTEKQAQKEMRVFEDSINLLKGLRVDQTPKSIFGAFVDMLTRLAYGKFGGNMIVSQLAEVGGSGAHSGFTLTLPRLFPALSTVRDRLNARTFDADVVREAHFMVAGQNLKQHLFTDGRFTRFHKFSQASVKGSAWRYGDKAGQVATAYANIASAVNRMSPLTNKMVYDAEEAFISDSFKFFLGENMSSGWRLRTPFGKGKLQATGIDEKMAKQMQADGRKYLQFDRQGNVTGLDIRRWRKEAPDTANKWEFMLFNHSNWSIVQDTIGNRSIYKGRNAFAKLGLQFKDFTLKAVNSQSMRSLSFKEREAVMSLIYGTITNGMAYYGLTVARAWAYFPNDEAKREAYLEERASMEMVIMAGVMRNAALTSFLSFGQDVYEAVTGSQSFRTTVDRTAQYGRTPKNAFEGASRQVEQLPAMRALNSTLVEPTMTAWDWAMGDEDLSERDQRRIAKALPLETWIPTVWFLNQFIDD